MLPREGRRPRDAFEEHAAEREDVGARIEHVLAADLLRRQIPRRPQHRPGLRRPRHARDARDAEVEHLDPRDVAAGEEEVARLDVAVNDVVRVRLGERRGDARPERYAGLDPQAPAPEEIAEVLTLDPLHDQVGLFERRRPVGDVADDVRVMELREHLRLALQARLVLALRVAQHLDGDMGARRVVTGLEHDAHCPRPERSP